MNIIQENSNDKNLILSPQVDLCAHATLASAHTLFSNGFVGSDTVEFLTRSGTLTAKKVSETLKFFGFQETESFLIELDFPVIPTCDYNSNDKLIMFSKALNGATIVDIRGTTTDKIISKAFNGASKASSTDKIIVSTFYICLFFFMCVLIYIHLIFRLCFKLGNLSLNCSQEWMIY